MNVVYLFIYGVYQQSKQFQQSFIEQIEYAESELFEFVKYKLIL